MSHHTIHSLINPPVTADISTLIPDIKNRFCYQLAISSIVVTNEGKAAGLIMSHHLDRLLGTRFGFNLYCRRNVSVLMDPKPLIINSATPLEQAAAIAMGRDESKIYDDIIVIGEDEIIGVLTVKDLLLSLAELQKRKNDELIKALKKIEEYAMKAEKDSRSKTTFLTNMSHEIRTPMNAIIGMADMLLDSGLNEEQKDYAMTIVNSGDILLQLINDILDLSKIEAGKLSLKSLRFSPDEEIQKVASLLSLSACEKNLDILIDADKTLPDFVTGDPHRFRQILTNLAGNAIKFTMNGHVCIKGELVKNDFYQCTLLFEVNDTGIGISQEEQTRLFRPFSQVDNSLTSGIGGTGLGLAISKQLVEMMGGTIGFSSKPCIGSSFYFTVIFDHPEFETIESDISSNGWNKEVTVPEKKNLCQITPNAFSAKILVAEDNPVNRKLAGIMLKKMGHTVVFAENGMQALEKLKEEKFDIVLMDIQMPVMDGLSASKAIRERSVETLDPDIPVIAMTAHAIEGFHQRCIENGMNDYIAKPVRPDVIQKMLIKWYGK